MHPVFYAEHSDLQIITTGKFEKVYNLGWHVDPKQMTNMHAGVAVGNIQNRRQF